jgi:hypothetical protein
MPAGFHYVTARSRWARILKFMKLFLFQFQFFFSGRGKSRITETVGTESVDTEARLYMWNFSEEIVLGYRESLELL